MSFYTSTILALASLNIWSLHTIPAKPTWLYLANPTKRSLSVKTDGFRAKWDRNAPSKMKNLQSAEPNPNLTISDTIFFLCQPKTRYYC